MLPPMWPRPTKPIFEGVVAAISTPPLDRGDVVIAQLQIRRPEDRIDLGGAAETGDGSVHGRVAKGPGHGDRPRRGVVLGPHPAEPLHQLEVPGELGLPKALTVPAPVILGQRLDPLPRHRAGEQSRGHRRVHDDADPSPSAKRRISFSIPRSISEYGGCSVSTG